MGASVSRAAWRRELQGRNPTSRFGMFGALKPSCRTGWTAGRPGGGGWKANARGLLGLLGKAPELHRPEMRVQH